MTLVPQPGILDIALYQGGESRLAGHADVLKLSSNENPFGPPPSATEAATRALAEAHRYPPTDHSALRAAIGEVHGLDPDRIVCGVGSDEVLQFLAQAYAGPGDEVIHTRHGFSMYPILARMAGATPVMVEETERRVDVDAILGAATDRTRLVFLANPANPTGTMLAEDEVERLADGLPASAILVLDGAYAEYVDGFDGGARLATMRANVVMTRTFSKIYGLGGLRIGWGYGPRAVIDVLNRVRQPFNLSAVQLAAAEAAMRDRPWVESCRLENARQRARLAGGLGQLGLAVDAPQANFVLPRFDSAEAAEGCDAALRDAGIIVRRVAGYGLPEALRITVGDAAAVDRVLAAVASFLGDRA